MKPNDPFQINGEPMRFVGYAPIYKVDCAVFIDRTDRYTIMKQALADSSACANLTGYTDLVMMQLPNLATKPVHVDHAVGCIFGISPGQYSFVRVFTETYSSLSCSEKFFNLN